MRRSLYLVPFAFIVGCSSASTDSTNDSTTDGSPTSPLGGPGTGNVPGTGNTQAPAAKPVPDANLTEVVNVLIDGDRGLCTGTLVAKNVVVTAAHCLDRTFHSWDVVAPLAGGQKSSVAQVRMFDDDFEDVAHPDIGAIVLSEPIELDAYAQLTDLTARVANGGKVPGFTMVRSYVDSEAPLKLIPGLEISSGEPYGYEHGLVTKFFSQGGDSGAGLFAMENGKRTHELVGVARQPEPDTNLDHFTRIDAAFIKWVKSLE